MTYEEKETPAYTIVDGEDPADATGHCAGCQTNGPDYCHDRSYT